MFIFCWLGWHERRWTRRRAYRLLETLHVEFDSATGMPRLVASPERYYADRLEEVACVNCGRVFYVNPPTEDWHWA